MEMGVEDRDGKSGRKVASSSASSLHAMLIDV